MGLFTRSRFEATINAGTAHPRQTDLFASYDQERHLVEAKWESSAAGVPEVDELRIRLQETPAGAVGVLISMNGFTDSVAMRVAAKRTEPILLINRDELPRTLSGALDLHDLLRYKFDVLVRDGQAHTGEISPRRHSAASEGGLPKRSRSYASVDGKRHAWLTSKGGFSPIVFVVDLHGATWRAGSDGEVAFDLGLPRSEAINVVDDVNILWQQGWLTKNAHGGIYQQANSWHGFGLSEFLNAITQRDERYTALTELHHTEEVRLYDTFPGGHLALSADVTWHPQLRIRHRGISLRMDGVPYDSSKIRRLVDALDVDPQELAYRVLQSSPIMHLRPPEEVRGRTVEVLGYVIENERYLESDTTWVVAVVIENPFRDRPPWLADIGAPLAGCELLVCALHDQHPVDNEPRRYHLARGEYVSAGATYGVRFVADW